MLTCERCETPSSTVLEIPVETGLVVLDEGKRRGFRLCKRCRDFWRVDALEGAGARRAIAPSDADDVHVSPTASTLPPPSAAARTVPLFPEGARAGQEWADQQATIYAPLARVFAKARPVPANAQWSKLGHGSRVRRIGTDPVVTLDALAPGGEVWITVEEDGTRGPCVYRAEVERGEWFDVDVEQLPLEAAIADVLAHVEPPKGVE